MSFRVGDLVLKRDRKKSDKVEDRTQKPNEKFIGPFKISHRLFLVVYHLVSNTGKYAGKEHIRNLKPYVQRNSGCQAYKLGPQNQLCGASD